MRNKNPSILVVGSINMDLVLRTTKIPEPGESLLGKNFTYIPGGKGANQAVAASRLGASVSFAGKVGNDVNGLKLMESLKAENISTEFLFISKKFQTGLAVVMLEANGQNRILVYPEANMGIRKDEIRNVLERNYDAILLQFEIPEDIIIEICRLAKEKDIPVLVDAGPAQNFPLEKIRGIQVLSPNETEAFALTGIKVEDQEQAAKAATILHERSRADCVIIKMGENGSALFYNGHIDHFPAYKVQAVDPTAAGDAFMAAFAIKWLQTKDIKSAVNYATIAGALTTTTIGAQPSLPQLEEIDRFIQEKRIKK